MTTTPADAAAVVPGNAARNAAAPLVRSLGLTEYAATWHAMRAYTAERDPTSPDEIWLLQHSPVYTLGVAGRLEHLPRADNGIPIIRSDRGGQVTYHGPGQAVAYLLLDLRRRGLTVRPLVSRMESAVIDLLGDHGVVAGSRPEAPGVYVGSAKIAAVGLRIRKGCCYHGIAINVDMDLTPFQAIDPCGYPGLAVTQMRDLGIGDDVEHVAGKLARYLIEALQ